jgi:hypothetical protein
MHSFTSDEHLVASAAHCTGWRHIIDPAFWGVQKAGDGNDRIWKANEAGFPPFSHILEISLGFPLLEWSAACTIRTPILAGRRFHHGISTIGIDLSKTTFHMVGLGPRGEIVLRKKLSRKQLLIYTATRTPILIWNGSLRGGSFPRSCADGSGWQDHAARNSKLGK